MLFLFLACFNLPTPNPKTTLSLQAKPNCKEKPQTLSLPAHITPSDPRLQSERLIVIQKSRRKVMLYHHGKLKHNSCWTVGLGFEPKGHKTQEGDGRTPEGWYQTSDKPESQYYGAIAIHYPNTADALAGKQNSLINSELEQDIIKAINTNQKPPQQTPLGGEILIHGGGSSSDWTLGCAAMNNDDLDQLRAQLPSNMQAQILILP